MSKIFACLLCVGLLLTPSVSSASSDHSELARSLPLWSVVPFVLLLLGIAVLPLAAPHWWESNRNKGIVAVACGIAPAIYFAFKAPDVLLHTGIEYFSFLTLLFSLFVISGAIFISGDIRATPKVNTLFLLIGAVLANFVGTTGAAMLLIRPMLRTNSERKNIRHIPVFFIFVVANVGGCLLPIGDPPLFLGFLRGVPFFWTLKLILPWAMAVGLILVVFYVMDTIAYSGESAKDLVLDTTQIEPIRIHGKRSIPLLLGVVGAVAALPSVHLPADHWYGFVPWREIVMLVLAGVSLSVAPLTKEERAEGDKINPRKANEFSFHAIEEVAVLFAGIFAAMIPALMILQARGGELPVHTPWQFFFATGGLSSFLDNAPTYLTFLALAQGQGYAGANAIVGVSEEVLKGISLGAVFMGAMTYIGNAPNFMVKSISDGAGVKCPSFGGYFVWACIVLLPIFIAVNFVFLGLRLF
ncbi:MAG TPA: sodium:proton antiporter [Polyangiaceae bacterium]|nr:sodium:proton antiporter [Polyangiaceae bacterium]HMR76885.1 sodium:proton antiporter [Polyangiaceae bacterium]